jgi:type I restriction enzyme, S subunit
VMAWQEKKLGDVLALEYGKPLAPGERHPEGKYAVYGANGIKDWSNKFFVNRPSIIVGRKGSAGEITLTEDKFWPLDVTYFVTFDDAKYDLQFLYHLLSSQELTKLAKGVKPGINRNEVYAKTVRVPPLPEQQRIVAILDEAFAGLATATANAERNLKNARELFESYLNSAFQGAGDLVALSTLASEVTDGDHMPPPKSEEGIPFITISNINKDTHEIEFSDTFKVPEAYYAGLKDNRTPRRGDVLYTVTGSFGIPVVVNSDKKFCFQRHIGLVRPKAGVVSKWLYYALRSKLAFDQADTGATGTAQKTVSLKLLRSIRLPRMSSSAQEAVMARLDSADDVSQQLEAIYRRRIDAVWSAPGSEGTELGVLMEPEVRHGEAEVYTRVQA